MPQEDEIIPRQSINIRSKPTIIDHAPPSPSLIEEDLRAAVQLDSIDDLATNKFKVKDPEPRQPAPIPEAVSPAGIEIDLTLPSDRDLPEEKGSSQSEFIVDLSERLDYTLEGKLPNEYRRNMKGTLMVLFLFLVSVNLFLVHCNMFSYLENFYTSFETVLATLLYIISTLCILVMFGVILMVPDLSLKTDKFKVFYSPILVAGGLDFIAVVLGGGIFSPLQFHSNDPFMYDSNLRFGAAFTLLLNGLLYFLFTRSDEESKLFSLMHPFQRTESNTEPDVPSKEFQV